MRRVTRPFLLFLIFAWGSHVSFAATATPTSLKLIFEDRTMTLNFLAQPKLITREPVYGFTIGEQTIPLDFGEEVPPEIAVFTIDTDMAAVIDRAALESFLRYNLSLLDENTDPVKLTLNDKGWVSILGFPKSGYTVDIEALEGLINGALGHGYQHVRVPASLEFSGVAASPELIDRGIKEVLTIGHSNFSGSSSARRQNIAVAARKYSGLIIEQGEQFSFNRILGSVDPADGFVEELVIKGNDTEKEFGGGVCQVSTTVYRAAFEGGLQIDQRRNHSYAVPYYKPHGLDATIYLGGQDFRFTNDTPGDLLIQTAIYGDNIYFVFYGTSDGRKVYTNGPFVSNYRPAPEPIVEETTALPPGQEAYLSSAHDGFDATWIRTVHRPGEATPEKQTFASYYKAWPAKVLRGAADPALLSLENSTFAPQKALD